MFSLDSHDLGVGGAGEQRVSGMGVLPEKTLPHRAEGLPGRVRHPKKGVHGWCLALSPAPLNSPHCIKQMPLDPTCVPRGHRAPQQPESM